MGCTYERNIQELGLTNHYKEREDFRQICGEIDSLAFLPVEDVPAGMQVLKARCPDEAVPLLEYLARNKERKDSYGMYRKRKEEEECGITEERKEGQWRNVEALVRMENNTEMMEER